MAWPKGVPRKLGGMPVNKPPEENMEEWTVGEKERLEEAERRIGNLMDDREMLFKRLKALEDRVDKGITSVFTPPPVPSYQDPNPFQCIKCNKLHKNRHETGRLNDNGLWECKGGCK